MLVLLYKQNDLDRFQHQLISQRAAIALAISATDF